MTTETGRRAAPPEAIAAAKRARRQAVISRLVLSTVGVIVALIAWQLLADQQGFALPSPLDTSRDISKNLFSSTYLEQKGLSDGGGYTVHLWATTRNVLLGVSIGSVLGVSIGLLSLRIPLLSEVVNPLAAAFGAAPIFVAAPFFLIWFGIQPFAQILMVAFYTALFMYIFSRRAGDNLGAGYIESALTLGGKPGSIFRYIYLPGTVPEIAGGFRITLAGAWGLAAIAELLGSQEGAGFLIKFFATAFVVNGMMSLVVLLGLIAIFFDRLVVFAFTYFTRWSESGRQLAL